MVPEPAFTIGIEEEYLIVDRETRNLIGHAPPSILAECKKKLKEQVSPEFLQCQIEVGTRVCKTVKDARENLAFLRSTVSEVIEQHGMAMIASSTHPFSMGSRQETTNKDRYSTLERDLQQVARRLVICGMHVHIGIDDDDLRLDLMGQVSYALPHLLALSTSSPFWKGNDTGLKSYRIAVWDELPRTGLPEAFDSFAEYRRHVEVLINAGIIEDGTKIWWDIRPSQKFPTLEMRICDICTRLEDTICIAALYLCWLRMLYRLRRSNQRWRRYARLLIDENRWRAHRYGCDEGLIDFGRGEIVPYADLAEEMLEIIAEDAEFLDCVAEVEHARNILQRGTSAHRQLKVYKDALSSGRSQQEALMDVVDMLIEDTKYGLDQFK